MTPSADPSDRETATGKPRFRLARKLQFLEHILAEWKDYIGDGADSQALWEEFWDNDEIFGGALPGLEGTVHQHSRTLDRLMLDEYKAWYEEWMYYRKEPRVGHGPGTPYSELMEEWHFAQYERAEYQQAREKIDKRYGVSSSSKSAVPSEKTRRLETEGAASTPAKKAVQQSRPSKSLRRRADSDTTITTAMSSGWAAINDNTPASSVADNVSKDQSPADAGQASNNAQEVPETISHRQQLARRISEQVAAMAVIDDRGSAARNAQDEQAPWYVADVGSDHEHGREGVTAKTAAHSASGPNEAKDGTVSTKPASTSPAETEQSTTRLRKRSLPWVTSDAQSPRPLKSRARGTQLEESRAGLHERNQKPDDRTNPRVSESHRRDTEGGKESDQATAHLQESQHKKQPRCDADNESKEGPTQPDSHAQEQAEHDRAPEPAEQDHQRENEPSGSQPAQATRTLARPTLPITPTTSDPTPTQNAPNKLLKQSTSPPAPHRALSEHAQLSALLQNPSAATLSALVADVTKLSESLRPSHLSPQQPLTPAQSELADVLPEVILNAAKAAVQDADPVAQCAQLVRDLGVVYRGLRFA